MREFVVCVSLLVALGAMPAAASADPVPLASGFLNRDSEGTFFGFAGDGLLIQRVLDPASCCLSLPLIPETSCAPLFACRPGDLLNLSLRTDGEVPLGSGFAIVGGTTYPDLTFSGSLQFQVEPIGFPATTADLVEIEQPFVFAGLIRGFVSGSEAFVVSLTGLGTVRMPFERLTDGSYISGDFDGQISYQFADAAPVPEPATVLLVGCGLVAIARGRQRMIALRSRSAGCRCRSRCN